MRKKMAETIDSILSKSHPNESQYDALVSALIDSAAKQGLELGLEQAYQKIRERCKDQSFQNERLAQIKKIMEEPLFLEDKIQQIHRQKLMFGLIDENDPKIWEEYRLEVSNFTGSSLDEKSTLEKMSSIAINKVRYSTKPKSLIVMQYGPFYRSNGYIFYFIQKELMGAVPFDNQCDLSSPAAAQHLLELDNKTCLKMKILALKYCNSLELSHSPSTLLSRFSAQPNNPKILRYLLKLARQIHLVDINGVMKNCLQRAVDNGCLSNVMAILKELRECDIRLENLEYGNSDYKELVNNKKLTTQSVYADIFLLLKDYEDKLSGRLAPYFSAIKNEEKISTKLQIMRAIVLLDRLILQKYPYNELIDLLNNSLFEDESLSLEYYKKNPEILLEADTDKIKSLHFIANFASDLNNDRIIYLMLKKHPDFLKSRHELISLDMELKLGKQAYLGFDDRWINAYPDSKKLISESLQLHVSKDIIPLIMEYSVSIFDEMSAGIERLIKVGLHPWISSRLKEENLYALNEANSLWRNEKNGDCGYLSLWNALKVLSEMTFPVCYLKRLLTKDFKNMQKQLHLFINWIKSGNQNENLTALDIERILKRATQEAKNELQEWFPNLGRNYSILQSALGISPYSILEIDQSGISAKSLTQIKFQIAINFYTLSQRKDEQLLHCLLIHADQHWHASILVLSYSTKVSFKLFRMDGAETSEQTLQTISRCIDSLLQEPEKYIKETFRELMLSIRDDLIQFSSILKTGQDLEFSQEPKAYEYCQWVIQFFFNFGRLSLSKEYLPVLELARKTAQGCLKKNSLEFASVLAELSRLRNLYAEEKSQTAAFFSSVAAVATQCSPSPSESSLEL